MKGGCGCGNITVHLRLTQAPDAYTARRCLCSFCTERGALYVSDPDGLYEITIADDACVERKRFGTQTADFMVCTSCDGFIGAVCDTPTGRRAVVNLKCLQGGEAVTTKIQNFDYDAETVEQRLARRGRNWTPVAVSVKS